MKRIAFIALAAGAIVATGAPQADAKTEHPALAPFHAIRIAGVARLEFVEAPRQSVSVTARPAVLKRLRLTVVAGVLDVRTDNVTVFGGDDKVVLTVTAPRLDRVDVGGVTSGTLRGLSGANFALRIAGAGSITVAGSVTKALLSVSGTGSINASRLITDDLVVDISGAGSLRGHANHAAYVSVSGVGSATIAGNPPVRDVAKSGVGSVTFD